MEDVLSNFDFSNTGHPLESCVYHIRSDKHGPRLGEATTSKPLQGGGERIFHVLYGKWWSEMLMGGIQGTLMAQMHFNSAKCESLN